MRLFGFLAGLLTMAYCVAPPGSCPSEVCLCIWKTGKPTVECKNRGLITIPELIEPATQVLDMVGNNLQTLPHDAFARTGLVNLQRIYLRDCKLGQIHDLAFRGLANLVELDLSNNFLVSVPTLTFQVTPFLRDLILAHNPIRKLQRDDLNTLTNLQKLDLSHCNIQDIEEGAFSVVVGLETLKLNDNELSELPPKALFGLLRMRSLDLHENLWRCDCHLRELKVWLTDHNIPMSEAPKCKSGPIRVADRTFAELKLDDFACKPEILPVSRYIEGSSGHNATIICQASAVPSAAVKWYLNGKLLLNNTPFGSNQKLYIIEEGEVKKKSSLVITNAQEIDSGEFYCTAENKAGKAEANFTLHVSPGIAVMATLSGAQIASLGAAMFLMIVVILLVALVLLMRLKGTSVCESKSPGRIENGGVTNGSIHMKSSVQSSTTTDGLSNPVGDATDAKCNPVQKPPRISDMPYTTNHYEGCGSIISTNGPAIVSPTASGNDPDLINDTRPELIVVRPGSGEYARETSDSLYPSGLWEREHGILPRTSSTALPTFYTDRTPIIENSSVEGSQEEIRYTSKTFPRSHNLQNGYPPDYGLPMVTAPTPVAGKTLRVWQRAPPVLPPVSALKRALTSNRSSPDEGYQEGCGTDV